MIIETQYSLICFYSLLVEHFIHSKRKRDHHKSENDDAGNENDKRVLCSVLERRAEDDAAVEVEPEQAVLVLLVLLLQRLLRDSFGCSPKTTSFPRL